jgi:hypothetical protein
LREYELLKEKGCHMAIGPSRPPASIATFLFFVCLKTVSPNNRIISLFSMKPGIKNRGEFFHFAIMEKP